MKHTFKQKNIERMMTPTMAPTLMWSVLRDTDPGNRAHAASNLYKVVCCVTQMLLATSFHAKL